MLGGRNAARSGHAAGVVSSAVGGQLRSSEVLIKRNQMADQLSRKRRADIPVPIACHRFVAVYFG